MEWIHYNILHPIFLITGTIVSIIAVICYIKKRKEDKRIFELNQRCESIYADLLRKKALAQRELLNPAQQDKQSYYEALLKTSRQFRNIRNYRNASELAIECEYIAEGFNEERMISSGYVKRADGKWIKPPKPSVALNKLIMQNRERERERDG